MLILPGFEGQQCDQLAMARLINISLLNLQGSFLLNAYDMTLIWHKGITKEMNLSPTSLEFVNLVSITFLHKIQPPLIVGKYLLVCIKIFWVSNQGWNSFQNYSKWRKKLTEGWEMARTKPWFWNYFYLRLLNYHLFQKLKLLGKISNNLTIILTLSLMYGPNFPLISVAQHVRLLTFEMRGMMLGKK